MLKSTKIDPTQYKQLFLVDGFGALLTAFLLAVVLGSYHTMVGMPLSVLYALAGIAAIFAIYSFTNYRLSSKNWRLRLSIIAIANLTYCCLTAGLLVYFRQMITVWGILYFLGEIAIVVLLAIIELKMASKPPLEN